MGALLRLEGDIVHVQGELNIQNIYSLGKIQDYKFFVMFNCALFSF
jgi:hypothetical protein